jgi:hypothetical protein
MPTEDFSKYPINDNTFKRQQISFHSEFRNFDTKQLSFKTLFFIHWKMSKKHFSEFSINKNI